MAAKIEPYFELINMTGGSLVEVVLLFVLITLFIGFGVSVHAASKNQTSSVLTKQEIVKSSKQNEIDE
jgi:Zn-dependent membrane protease YugP